MSSLNRKDFFLMLFKKVIQQHDAAYQNMGGLDTWQALPFPDGWQSDPFLLLNHHGPQEFPPHNQGLPFGPHPHRGFETLTFVERGDIVHRDSTFGESTIHEGGIQWMTAGSGLVHAEVSSERFKREGGVSEVLQLWMNLPAHLKNTPPNYTGLEAGAIPAIALDGEQTFLRLVSGRFAEVQGPVDSLTGLTTGVLSLVGGGRFSEENLAGRQVLCYVVRGNVQINGQAAETHQTVALDLEGDAVEIEAASESCLIYAHGKPIGEPVVSHGPFVMNTADEIHQAIRDYQEGRMGSLPG